MLEEDQELFGEFLEESSDTITKLYETLDGFSSSDDKEESINKIFRGVHTIKGSCIMFGMIKLHEVAHNLESYITPFRNTPETITTEILDYITSEVDKISTLLQSGDEAAIEIDTPPTSIIEEEKQSPSSEIQSDSFIDELIEKSKFFKDYISMFDDLFLGYKKGDKVLFELEGNEDLSKIVQKVEKFGFDTLNTIRLNESSSAYLMYNTQSPLPKESMGILNKLSERDILNWILPPTSRQIEEGEKIPQQELLVIDSEESQADRPKVAEQKRQELIRVPEERINQALDNIWELFLIRNQLSYLIDTNYKWLNKRPEFVRSWELLDSTFESNITELESRTMRMRMSSLKNIYSRLGKVVRTYTRETGKKINFKTEGDKTELDKKVIDMLYDPLVHLIRNSMDHGIESPEARKKNDKPDVGTISISSKVVGSEVIITVADDGKGIDHNKIVKHANEKGLDTSWIKTKEEAIKLIFTPGFSTAQEISAVSGRGVGMDAVVSSVQSIGGDLDVETEVGSGTVFKISLPLSMSVVSALVMNVNNCKIACATSSIVETKRLRFTELKRNSGELFYLDHDTHIPCIQLDKHLYLEHSNPNPLVKKSEVHACMVEVGSRKMALLVDSIDDYSNLVIKPMPKKIPFLPFVNGVSILATGDPIFIFSPHKIIAEFNAKSCTGARDE